MNSGGAGSRCELRERSKAKGVRFSFRWN